MKKFFSNNKNIYSKLILSFIIVILMEITFAKPVSAKQYSFGGTLLQPVIQFGAFVADGVIEILQNSLLGTDGAFEEFDITKNSMLKKVLLVIAAAIVCVGAAVWAFLGPGKAAAAKIAAKAGTKAVAIGIGIISRISRSRRSSGLCKDWNA